MTPPSEKLDISTFTVVLPANALTIPVSIGIGQFDPGQTDDAKELFTAHGRVYEGVIDTGASSTCISTDVAEELNLVKTGYIKVGTANGICEHSCHVVNLSLPNAIVCPAIQVTAGDIGVDLLLGMDILGRGDLHITHHHGYKVVNFHMYNIVRADSGPDLDRT